MAVTLVCTPGVWTGPADSRTYQWQRSPDPAGLTGWANIPGATASSYTITPADDRYRLRCLETATNMIGSATAASNAILAPPYECTYTLELALDAAVAGVFTVDSALDGTDGLTDTALSDGTYTDISSDVQDPYQVVFGTDNLLGQAQAGNLTVTVASVDDPGYWNPANPSSPLASDTPGLVPMRPIQLTAVKDRVVYPVFTGYTSRGLWDSSTRSLQLYCEDFLLWASRVYPTIASTGPTTMGAVFRLLVAAVDPTLTPIADQGILLPDFSADGTLSVTQILANLLAADLGTVYVGRDGIPVYRQADHALAAASVATVTITEQTSEEQTGFDVTDIGTRVTVEQLDGTGTVVATASRVNAAAELTYGRADLNGVSSAYVEAPGALADELLYRGVRGKPPVQFTLADVDDTTLLLMLTSAPLTVYTVDDPFAGTAGDAIAQRISHTIKTGLHGTELLCVARDSSDSVMTVDSALDGADGLRYP